MSSACIKARNYISVLIFSYWELCLIPIMVWLLHSDNRLHNLIKKSLIKTTYSHKVILHFILFKNKLLLIIKRLYLAASALPVVWTDRLCTLIRFFNYFFKMGVSIIFLGLHDLRLNPVSYNRILNKEGIAIYFAYTFSINAYILNNSCYYIVFLIFHLCPHLN